MLLKLVDFEEILVRITAAVPVELTDFGKRYVRHYSVGIMAFVTDRSLACGTLGYR